MGSERSYTTEELATANQAWKDFADEAEKYGVTYSARDCAMFDAGFKRGRRTPPPATARKLEATRKALAAFELHGWDFSQFADLIETDRAFVAEWPLTQKTAPGGAAKEGE